MSILFDDSTKNDTPLKDFSLLEKLFWSTLDNEENAENIHTLLSYGSYGRYVFNVLFSPDRYIWSDGKPTDRKLAHFCTNMTEQGNVAVIKTGLRTGDISTTGKAQTKQPGTIEDMFDSFDELLARHPAQSNPSSTNNWIRAWHVGLAVRLGLLPTRFVSVYRSEVKLGDNAKYNFVVRNCLTLSPIAMRRAWNESQKAKTAKAKTAKAQKSEVKTSEPTEETALSVAVAKAEETKA